MLLRRQIFRRAGLRCWLGLHKELGELGRLRLAWWCTNGGSDIRRLLSSVVGKLWGRGPWRHCRSGGACQALGSTGGHGGGGGAHTDRPTVGVRGRCGHGIPLLRLEGCVRVARHHLLRLCGRNRLTVGWLPCHWSIARGSKVARVDGLLLLDTPSARHSATNTTRLHHSSLWIRNIAGGRHGTISHHLLMKLGMARVLMRHRVFWLLLLPEVIPRGNQVWVLLQPRTKL